MLHKYYNLCIFLPNLMGMNIRKKLLLLLKLFGIQINNLALYYPTGIKFRVNLLLSTVSICSIFGEESSLGVTEKNLSQSLQVFLNGD